MSGSQPDQSSRFTRRNFLIGAGATAAGFALYSGEFSRHQIDIVTRTIPIANQPVRGFSFAKGQGYLTSLASARSDIWLLEGFKLRGNRLSQWWRP